MALSPFKGGINIAKTRVASGKALRGVLTPGQTEKILSMARETTAVRDALLDENDAFLDKMFDTKDNIGIYKVE